MDFHCEDLPDYGIHLTPPTSPQYARLLHEIEQRGTPPGVPPYLERSRIQISDQDPATSAILLNRSGRTIAAMRILWLHETVSGRRGQYMRDVLSPDNVLLPFGRRENTLQINRYWTTIFPGSRRFLCKSGMAGNNGDVRPPEANERFEGAGFYNGGATGGWPNEEPVRAMTLALDGVFFIDGGFAGRNTAHLLETTIADVEAHRLVGRIARDGHNRDLPASQIFANIEKAAKAAPGAAATGDPLFSKPNATMEDFRSQALDRLAMQFTPRPGMPEQLAEARVLSAMTWDETVVPNFRRI